MTYQMPFNNLLNPGHSACAGCGELIAMRHVLQAAGPNTIISNATGCSEVTTSRFPFSSFKVPWIHANFENAVSVASGILAALKVKSDANNRSAYGYGHANDANNTPDGGRGNVHSTLINSNQLPSTNLLVFGGDGATFDIGVGLISGSWERRENILYVCFNNEGYMNTGAQASGSTPLDANTTTTPPGRASSGNELVRKNMVNIALAHDCVYVATATVADTIDIENKVKKALSMNGPKYLEILCTCVPGWHTESKDTIKVARLAQQTGIYPVLEYVSGQLVNVAHCPKSRPLVEEYLKLQGRYKHLFKPKTNTVEIARIQKMADENVKKFGL
ncbi:MAG: thiamine pyrophosphate-dependent enzyme [Parcubacteria group bacterium]